jgi:hypothetical protein
MIQRVARPIISVFLLAISLGLTSCGVEDDELPKKTSRGEDVKLQNPQKTPGNSNTGLKSDTARAKELGLAGTFITGCYGTNDPKTHIGMIADFQDEFYVQYNAQFVATPEKPCSQPVFVFARYSVYTIGKEIQPARYEVDLTTQGGLLSVWDQGLANEANKAALYGYTNWKVGEYKDITNKPSQSGQEPAVVQGTKVYTIFGLQADTLFLADDSVKTGQTPETRPTELSTNVPFHKDVQGFVNGSPDFTQIFVKDL